MFLGSPVVHPGLVSNSDYYASLHRSLEGAYTVMWHGSVWMVFLVVRGVPVVRPLELLVVVNVAFLLPVSSEPSPAVLLSCTSLVQLNSIGHFANPRFHTHLASGLSSCLLCLPWISPPFGPPDHLLSCAQLPLDTLTAIPPVLTRQHKQVCTPPLPTHLRLVSRFPVQ